MILSVHYKLNHAHRIVTLHHGLRYARVKKDVFILNTDDNENYTLFIKGKAFCMISTYDNGDSSQFLNGTLFTMFVMIYVTYEMIVSKYI